MGYERIFQNNEKLYADKYNYHYGRIGNGIDQEIFALFYGANERFFRQFAERIQTQALDALGRTPTALAQKQIALIHALVWSPTAGTFPLGVTKRLEDLAVL